MVRSADVSDELWNSLGRNIAPGRYARDGDGILLPLERFLGSRNWLAQALTVHGCEATFDDSLLAVLQRSDAERGEVRTLLSGTGLPSISPETALRGTRFVRPLKPFQVRDLGRMLALSHGANFSVPGAGKTAVAYACYEAEQARGRVDRLLVVAPLSAFEAWFEEAELSFQPTPHVQRFGNRILARTEVLLVNYQLLAARFSAIARWVSERPCHVVLDEAHRMKRGRDGEWGSACLDLGHLAIRRDILTGTPAPQHPTDFIALLDFLWPNQSTRILPVDVRMRNPSDGVMVDVSNRLRPLFVRTKKDELGLEPPRLSVELVTMKPLQAEIYEALRTKMRQAIASARDRAMLGHLGEVVMYMLEAATNPTLLVPAITGAHGPPIAWPPIPIPPGSSLADRVVGYARHEIPRKFEKLAAMVAENARRGRKTLVWSNFVTNLERLKETLAPHEPALIHGGVPSGGLDESLLTREVELRRFRRDDRCMVLLANPAAMAEGVSLHEACHDAIYVDRTFNAGQYLQSLDRIHRLGLAPGTETRIIFLASRGTIDETVDQRVRVKAERLSQMLSDPNLVTMALPDDESYGEWIDPGDVDALFTHLHA